MAVLVAVVVACACGSEGPSSPPSGGLPRTVGGQPITYRELPASELGSQLVFFEGPIKAVGGDLTSARVAIGLGPHGFTLTALQVPGADGRKMIDPMIDAAGFQQTNRQTRAVGGRGVTVLTLPPTTLDRAYVYAFGDTVIVVTTSEPAFADEAIRSLP